MFTERIKTHHSAMADAKAFAMGPRQVVSYLQTTSPHDTQKKNGTIYIHVPFCSKICSFCNMRRSLQKPREDYHKLVVEEINRYSELKYIKEMAFDAIYFGGGTPTTLDTEALRAILRALKRQLTLTKEVEITIETTVTELTDEKLQMFKEEGVNRFSVGVQTFNDRGRALMGRVGSGEVAYNKLKQIKGMGFKTVSMDLIYSYPGQTKADLIEDLEKIKALGLDGFSMYSLIDMKATRIEDAQQQDVDDAFYFEIAKRMKEAGYDFLELTKMVRDDQYKYIMNRHQAADTLPLGAGAGGSVGGLMMMNEIQLDKYEGAIERFEEKMGMLFSAPYRNLTLFKGSIQTGYLPGDTESYVDYNAYQEQLQAFIDADMVTQVGERYKLTTKGIYWGNNISRVLYDMRIKA